MIELLRHTMEANGLLTAFVVVGVMMWVSNWISKTLTGGRLHGSAIAVFGGLILTTVGGSQPAKMTESRTFIFLVG
jgi:hypothetical protein